MAAGYKVRIWAIRTHENKTKDNTYSFRWIVEGAAHTFTESFDTYGSAEAYRSKLITARSSGEAFDLVEGLPLSMIRERRDGTTWYELTKDYVDLKWPHRAPGSRRTLAESIATLTCGLVEQKAKRSAPKNLYAALVHWAYNKPNREAGPPPIEYTEAIRWIERHSLAVSAFLDPKVVRLAYTAITVQSNGTKFKANTVESKRTGLTGPLAYALEIGLLDVNPLLRIKFEHPRKTAAIDRRCVVNMDQARALIRAVKTSGTSGPLLVAFFATLYFAGLRPSEALDLRKGNCELPEKGWGSLTFANANPYSGKEWTDNGQNRQRKELKHRAEDESRTVPACPELVAHLRAHIAEFGTADDGRIFQSLKGEVLSQGTYDRVWKKARVAVLSADQVESPLGSSPYDLRHACLSTWLNAGVHAPLVAEWAGHTVEMLLSTYAKCIHGQEEAARRRIAEALGGINLEDDDASTTPEDEEAPDAS
jgi:integrase